MKKKYRFMSVVCLMILAALPAGCSGGGNRSGEDNAAAENSGPLEAYDDEIIVSMMYETNAGTKYPNGDSIKDNVITRFFKEKLNVGFDLSWQVDSGNYATQLDLAIASNTDLPDMFIATKKQIYTLAASGLITEMSDYYEAYASDNLKEVLGFNSSEGLESATVMDGLYALPLTNDVGDGASLVFIRQDWLDRLGLKIPTTLSELIETAQAFVDNDMSGSGNTIGISLASDLGFTWDVIANAYGAYPDLWIEDGDGSLAYGSVQPEIKDALACMQRLYSSGLVHKEFAAQDTTRLAQYVAQGRLGIFIGPFWYNNNYIISNLNADPDAEWTVVNCLPLNEDGNVSSRAWNTTYRWLVVNKNYKNPEAAVKLLNLWYEMWQGQYSEWFWNLQMSEDYYDIDLKDYSPVFFDPPLKNTQLGIEIRNAYESGDTGSLNAEGLYNLSQLKENKGSAINRSANLCWFGSFKLINDTYTGFKYDLFRGPEDTVFNTMMTTLDTMERTAFTDIIMGDSLDTFDSFVNDWYAGGGQTVTGTVNEWYKNKQ